MKKLICIKLLAAMVMPFAVNAQRPQPCTVQRKTEILQLQNDLLVQGDKFRVQGEETAREIQKLEAEMAQIEEERAINDQKRSAAYQKKAELMAQLNQQKGQFEAFLVQVRQSEQDVRACLGE